MDLDLQRFLAVEFWALVTMASVLATALATAISMVTRHLARPEADWAVLPVQRLHSQKVGEPRDPGFEGRLMNAGDGPAFRVEVLGEACEAKLLTTVEASWAGARINSNLRLPVLPLLSPGDEGRLAVRCSADSWDKATVVISWTRPPTRRGKRSSVRIPLRQISAPPRESD